jgi:hypothetical protein
MAYIGKSIESGTFKVLDTSGNTYNGSNTTFSLGTQVGAAAQLLVSHDGVIQKPGTDYTLASGGASITFSTAPASGASIFIVEISGAFGGTITPSDTSVTADKLNTALLTGQTDIGANIADADLFLVDDGAGGTLRKTAASRIKTYVGGFDVSSITGATALAEEPALTDEMVISDAGTLKRVDMTHVFNTPGFVAKLSSDQSISHATWTKLALATEIADKSSTFDASTNYRFSPATAGLYHVGMGTGLEGIDDGEEVTLQIYKNGSAGYYGLSKNMATGNTQTINCTTDATFLLDNNDYLEFYIYQNEGGTISAQGNRTYAFAFRITGTEV